LPITEVHRKRQEDQSFSRARTQGQLTVCCYLVFLGICDDTRKVWPCRTVLQVERGSVLKQVSVYQCRLCMKTGQVSGNGAGLTVSVQASILTLLMRRRSVAWNGLMTDMISMIFYRSAILWSIGSLPIASKNVELCKVLHALLSSTRLARGPSLSADRLDLHFVQVEYY
jgi:hypothetical protein